MRELVYDGRVCRMCVRNVWMCEHSSIMYVSVWIYDCILSKRSRVSVVFMKVRVDLYFFMFGCVRVGAWRLQWNERQTLYRGNRPTCMQLTLSELHTYIQIHRGGNPFFPRFELFNSFLTDTTSLMSGTMYLLFLGKCVLSLLGRDGRDVRSRSFWSSYYYYNIFIIIIIEIIKDQ